MRTNNKQTMKMEVKEMKTIKDKQILVAADFAGVPLKNAIVEHLEQKGLTVTDIGVKTVDEENPEMFTGSV